MSGTPDHVHRLHEFGVRPGAVIRMFRSGATCIIQMDGNKLCLRTGGPLDVLVEPFEVA